MLAKITLYDGTVYKIASQTVDTEDGIYLGRIKDELSLVSAMQEAGNAPNTVSLTIINYDDFIPHSKDLWAADVLLTNDNGVSWRGKINFCNFDADGNLYVTASEKTAPELELQLPDEVRQVYTVDEDFHQSSVTMTIPLVIGGTSSNPITLPTILIDKTRGIYLICVGEIRSIVKVYNGTEELPNTAYTAYTGTSSQAEHAGFAYVQIAEDYRLNSDGTYAEINVDVVGLKLGNHTEAECRNGARFLYYFLTTADTGINGWGCGIDSSLIDTTSFNSAITLCDQLGYKLDGIMWLRQSAQSWIDQICQAIHGKYSINANGKRSLFIDYAGNASKKTFTASNMQVERYGKNSYTSVVYNKGILSYDYNPITGLFMQSAQYENAESIAQIGEQKFVGESYLIKDPTTALAVLEYTCKRSQTAAEAIEFKTDDIDTLLRAGDVITINRPDLSINNALYQIQNISITDYEASISAVKFDTSVFSVTGTASTVNWGNERDITPALTPAQATNLLLSTGFDINPDGTGIPYISGTFTVPDGGWFAAAVQYGIGTNPSNWTELALITDGRFKISPVNVGTVYSVRIRMITATGHSDYLRGQITATGDSTAPSAPTIAVKATDKTVTVQCGLDNPPYDMGGFQVYRKKSTDSVYTLIGSVAANRGYAAFSDYVDEYVTYNYKAKSYDRSGNLSGDSSAVSVTVTGITANDVAATALAMPTGSIMRLSAKNCTAASIAEANGVKDVSGRGNHLQAYGGVMIQNDMEQGLDLGFGFDGTDDYIYTNKSSVMNAFNYPFKGLTISAKIKPTAISTRRNIVEAFISGSTTAFGMYIAPSGQVACGGRRTANNSYAEGVSTTTLTENKVYTVTGVFDYENAKVRIFINGELDKEANFQDAGTFSATPTTLYIGKYSSNVYRFKGIISDFRIYPRALSASEIKTLYMFPDDVTFGQMTADLIGANIIKAENLIKTEALITTTAQIDQAVVNNLNVSGNATFTNGLANTLQTANTNAQGYATDAANAIDVGGRNLARGTAEMKQGSGGWSNGSWASVGTISRTYNADVVDSPISNLVSKGVILTSNSSQTSGGFRQNSVTLNAGKITMSCWAKGTQGATLRLEIISGTAAQFILTGDWQYITATRTATAGTQNFGTVLLITASSTVTVVGIKIEYGNKATTWTPAPEDVDADIASGDSSTLASAKTYADGKASTAQSNAEAAAASALAAVTSNIYYTGTTKINGGVIQTGSIGAAAIAANSITADKINVSSGTPRSCLFSLNFKSVQSATAGTPVPDMSGYGNHFKIAGTWNMLYKAAAYCEYILLDNTSAGRGHYISNQKAITVPLSDWTFLICAYAHANGSGEHILFDFKPSSGSNNRIQFRIDPDNNRIRIRSWDSSGTTESKYGALASCTRGSYLCYVVQCTSTTSITVYCVAQRRGDQLDTSSNKVTITLSNARSALTCAAGYMQIGGTDSTSEATASIVGNIGDIKFYNRELSLAELKQIVHNVGNYDSGLITADRIATDAIKSRNYAYTSGLYSTAGTFLDLANGQIISKNFSIDSSGNASFKGAVEASSGKIGNLSIDTQGALSRNITSDPYSSEAGVGFDMTIAGSHVRGCRMNVSGSAVAYKAILGNNGYGLAVQLNATGTAYNYGYSFIKDSTGTSNNQFGIYGWSGKCTNAEGWTSACDEKVKRDLRDVSTLDKLKNIRIKKYKYSQKVLQEKHWKYEQALKAEENLKKGIKTEEEPMPEFKDDENAPDYIMAMAGEFNKAFGVDNGNEEEINYTNAIGVALRAIQELAEISDAQKAEIDSQKAEIAELKAKLKIQQDEKSEIIEHFNELTKEPTDEDELVEPSFDELLKDDKNQEEGKK